MKRTTSPVDWFSVTYAFAFVPRDCDADPTCRIHENVVLVKALTADEAYRRTLEAFERISNEGEYKDESGSLYRSRFIGIRFIHVMVESPADLSEVLSIEYELSYKELEKLCRKKSLVLSSANTFGGGRDNS